MISFMKKLLHRDPKKRLAYRYKPNHINPLNSEPFFIQGSKLIEKIDPPIEITYMADDETADGSDQIYYNKIRKNDTRVNFPLKNLLPVCKDQLTAQDQELFDEFGTIMS